MSKMALCLRDEGADREAKAMPKIETSAFDRKSWLKMERKDYVNGMQQNRKVLYLPCAQGDSTCHVRKEILNAGIDSI